ncbi:hypothetical protein QCA50_019002 [Cerrena zonata]|uniref:non-specific serine/threonine protein kinase n=1 Tax=Cerrena zonata TaxID=2478898 RepID=A0AAW0FL51_9APHY
MFVTAQDFPRERENTADTYVPPRRKRKNGKARAALLPPINTTARPLVTPLGVVVTPNGTACFPEPPSAIDVSYSQSLTTEEEKELRYQLSQITFYEPPTPQEHDHENDCRPRHQPQAGDSPGSSSPTSTLSPQTPADFESINPGVRERLGSISPISGLDQLATSDLFPPSKTLELSTTEPKVGPFAELRKLQSGAYGCAYSVRDFATSRVVCVKRFVKEHTSSSRQFYVGLLTELIAYQHISSTDENARKFLMELHGAVQDTDSVMYVMDLMKHDLFPLLESGNEIERPKIERWIAQVALGIDALHKMGIMHRDIKPENILLVPGTNNVRITDFTNAWVSPLNVFEPLCYHEIYSRHNIGTTAYLAPEIHSKGWYGPAVDWWALGCVLFDLLTKGILFPDVTAVMAYIEWKASGKPSASFFTQLYPTLQPGDLDLLCGLLTAHTKARYRLKDVMNSNFFASDPTLFDRLRNMSLAEVRGETNTTDMKFDKNSGPRNAAVWHAKPSRPGKKAHSSILISDDLDIRDYSYFGWVSPNGIWAPS